MKPDTRTLTFASGERGAKVGGIDTVDSLLAEPKEILRMGGQDAVVSRLGGCLFCRVQPLKRLFFQTPGLSRT